MTPLPLQELPHLYTAGQSLSQIAKKYGVSSNTIRSRLLEMGVQLRKQGCPQNRKLIPLPLEEIKSLHDKGVSCVEIAKKYDVCERTIRNRLLSLDMSRG